MAIGTKNTPMKFGSDFMGHAFAESTVPTTTGTFLGGELGLTGVNEGALIGIYDESGGVLRITTDTGDNDNQVIWCGPFSPVDGGMYMEARFKIPTSVAATREAVWCGFAETLSMTTPVMPTERATATTTYNPGGALGMMFDGDSTILEFFAVAADGSAILANVDMRGTAGGANGIQVTGAAGIPGGTVLTADRWYVVRVEIDPSGLGRVYFGDYDGGNSITKPLQLVCRNTTALGASDLFFAVLMIENRAGADEELEVDYFFGEANRDWSAT